MFTSRLTLLRGSSSDSIAIWRTYAPNDHVTSLTSHSKAVTCLAFLPPSSSSSSKPQLLSGSADSTIILWSPLSAPPHNKERRFRHHAAVVNTVAPSPTDPSLFASGSDDGNICIWNVDERKPWETLGVGYPVTAIEWAKDGSGIFVGGIDNQIHVSLYFKVWVAAFSPICKGFLELTKSHGCFEQLYDLHRRKITYTLSAHSDTITSLRLSPSGSYLLSLSLDSSLKVWDVRPFAVASTTSADGSGDDPTAQRLSQTLSGALASNESLLIRASWSRDGKRITSGSGDRTCVVWDVESSRILYKLPGHRGTCTAAALHPTEPIGKWTDVGSVS